MKIIQFVIISMLCVCVFVSSNLRLQCTNDNGALKWNIYHETNGVNTKKQDNIDEAQCQVYQKLLLWLLSSIIMKGWLC